MEKIIYIAFIALFSAAVASCTSARWTVKEKAAIDEEDYEIVKEDYLLMLADDISPDDPVFELDLYSERTYEYTQRVLIERNIQEYRLRPGFMILGLGGAGMAFYLANSDAFNGSAVSGKSITLNAIGGLMAFSGFFNMKPVGEPRPTGEERYLRSSGSAMKTDTVRTTEEIDNPVSIMVYHNDQLIFEDKNRSLSEGSINISLAGILNEQQLSGPDPGDIVIIVHFQNSKYKYEYPVEDILQPYARVISPLTELRNSPEETDDNALADLMKGSQLQIQNFDHEEWYQVLYGISENYVRKENVELIWRSGDFIDDDQIVTVPRVPFGNIDVESNIPILRESQPNAIGLVITNESYTGDLAERSYTHRDGRLIKTYLTNALGYQQQNVFELTDVQDSDVFSGILSEISSLANDSTELFVYLGGYGRVATDEEPQLEFLGVNGSGNPPAISLRTLYEQISSISSAQTVVISDIDFNHNPTGNQFTANEERTIIETTADPIADHPRASLLIGSRLSHPSNLYVSTGGEDKKHHIFPYFFSKALQQRKTSMADIYQYLERNVSYTARKLYDRPQDPLLIGSTTLDLIPQ